MPKLKGEKQLLAYEYDFAADAGAIGAIAMRQLSGQNASGMIVTKAYVVVETALASGGTPTITFGNVTDPDGYMADVWAELSTKQCVQSGEVLGALIWDDTNDHDIAYRPTTADDLATQMTIGTAALTAGKLYLYLEVIGTI
jgi:hypothetical protein